MTIMYLGHMERKGINSLKFKKWGGIFFNLYLGNPFGTTDKNRCGQIFKISAVGCGDERMCFDIPQGKQKNRMPHFCPEMIKGEGGCIGVLSLDLYMHFLFFHKPKKEGVPIPRQSD